MKLISNLFDCPQDKLLSPGESQRQRVNIRSLFNFSIGKNVLLASLLLSGTFPIAAEPAFALGDKCKDVKITLKNISSDTLEVTKVEYKDFKKDKLRTEFMLGISVLNILYPYGVEYIDPGKSYTRTRNLEFVGNDETFILVRYRHVRDANGVALNQGILFSPPNRFVCKNNSSHTVELK
jgi:hypothetical protein